MKDQLIVYAATAAGLLIVLAIPLGILYLSSQSHVTESDTGGYYSEGWSR